MRAVIATTTFYKSTDELRFKLACNMIKNAVAASYAVVVIDGSPEPMIAKKFQELGALVYPETLKGMGPSRRLAFYYALYYLRLIARQTDGIIFWTEPEKYDIIRFIPSIVQPIDHSLSTIVIPCRTNKSWSTYPVFQKETEKAANESYAKETSRIGYDPMFGPVAFKASFIEQVLFWDPIAYDLPDTYIQHFLPLLIPQSEVWRIPVDFIYPPEQKKEEEQTLNEEIKKKRLWQMESLSQAYAKTYRFAKR